MRNTLVVKTARVSSLFARVNYLKYVRKANDTTLGQITADELKQLSPVFIKIGQFMSTRADVFGKEYTTALSTLQDDIPPFPINLPTSLTDSFSYIRDDSIATASIGQVHYGRLLNGDEVVIKVKRPRIKELIIEDFRILNGILQTIKLFNSSKQVTDAEVLLTQYEEFLLEEVDFTKERENMELFAAMFAEANIPWMKVPKTYPTLCDQEHLVMEYLHSTKINDLAAIRASGMDATKISKKLIECFLLQITKYGNVHTDPHPGNMGFTESGKIVLYDYGMVLHLENVLKKNFKRILLAINDQDVEELTTILVELDIVVVEKSNIPYLKKFVATFITYINDLDINDFRVNYLDKIDQQDVPFVLSSKFFMLVRGMSILEGVCRELDPDFSYQDVLGSFVNDFAFDLEYIERKGSVDLSNMRITPQKVALAEISIDILERKMESVYKRNTTLTRLLGATFMYSIFHVEPLPLPIQTGLTAITFMFLYTR